MNPDEPYCLNCWENEISTARERTHYFKNTDNQRLSYISLR